MSCRPSRQPRFTIKCFRGIPQLREIDQRNQTKDHLQGQGLQEPPPDRYLYLPTRTVLSGSTEIAETFPVQNQNRICLIDAYQVATQRDHHQHPPRWCLYDPKSQIQLYEIRRDENNRKVLCLVDECNTRKRLSNTNPPPDPRLYNCLIDDKNRFWRTERRNLKGPSKKTRRLCVQNSNNARSIPQQSSCCRNAKQKRNLIYEQRRGHHLTKTRYACNQPPTVNRVW